MGASLSAMIIKKISNENLKNNDGNGLNNAASVQASEVPFGGLPVRHAAQRSGKNVEGVTDPVNLLRDDFILNFKQGE